MFDKLEDLLIRYEEIMGELQEPDVVNDQSRFRKLMKEQNDLTPIVEKYKEYKAQKQNIRKQLEALGIDKSTLFPEVEHVAEHIKDKYHLPK